MPWITAALVSVAALWLLFQDLTPDLLDVALIFACVLVLVLLLCPLPRGAHVEAFTDPTTTTTTPAATPTSMFNTEETGMWVKGLATSGNLVTYVSTFSTKSHLTTGSSSTWISVAQDMTQESKSTPPAADNMDLRFSTAPQVKAGQGFALDGNTLTGPHSMLLLPSGTDYTVFCLFQLTGLPSASETLVSIPANGTPTQNGMTLSMSSTSSSTPSSIIAHVALTLGNQPALACGDNYAPPVPQSQPQTPTPTPTVSFDTNARYLLAVTHSSTSIRVSLFNVESTTSPCIPNTILSATLVPDILTFNNQPIVVNPSGAILGYIMAFGMFNAALSTLDEALLCQHYYTLLLQGTPAVQTLTAALAAAGRATACPYDATTCAACASVTSWADLFHIVNGGPACLGAINTYCTNNPTAAGCDCYNPTTMATYSVATQNACLAIQSAYSGNNSALCAAPVQQALATAQVASNTAAEAHAAQQAEDQDRQRAQDTLVATQQQPAKQTTWLASVFGLAGA